MITYKSNLPEVTLKYKSGEFKKSKIHTSRDCYEIVKEMFNSDTLEYIEEFIVLLLNRANNTIGWVKLSSGGITGTVVDVRVLFTIALQSGASSILIAHNHPSGNPKPSNEDLNITKKIKEAGKLLDISLLDHLIIYENSFTSMADEGLI